MTRGYKKDRRGWAQSRLRMRSWKNYDQHRRNLPWLPGEDLSLLKRRTALLAKKRRIGSTSFGCYSKTDMLWKLVTEHGRSYCAITARLAILDTLEELIAFRRSQKRRRA